MKTKELKQWQTIHEENYSIEPFIQNEIFDSNKLNEHRLTN